MSEPGTTLAARALVRAGVQCVFGIPGTQTVDLLESFRREQLRTVLAASEAGAAFMAGGWARVTGKPAVLSTIPGPGFAWALPGLAEARLDSVPLVHLTTAARKGRPRGFALQDIDQPGMAGPIVKQVFPVQSAGEIETALQQAFRASTSGEPGPVLVELDPEALSGQAASVASSETVEEPAGAPAGLDRLIQRVHQANRPLLLAGQGCSGDAGELLQLVNRLGAPVLTTPGARGVLSEYHPSALGFDPLSGNLERLNRLIASCDLVLVLGAKLGHNGSAGFGLRLPADRLIQVDAESANIGSVYPVSLGLVADVGLVLRTLAGKVRRSAWTDPAIADARRDLEGSGDPREPEVPPGVFETLNGMLDQGQVVVLDSGQHQISARRHLRVSHPRSLLFPSDFQSMGFAIPTAIGAALASPARPVNVVVGDGGFAMTGLELLTAVREGIRLNVFVFADGYLGQIWRQQLEHHGAEYAVALRNPDFAALAGALGLDYRRAGDADLAGLDRHGGVTLIEVPVAGSSGLGWPALKARVKGAARRHAPAGLLGLWARFRGWKQID